LLTHNLGNENINRIEEMLLSEEFKVRDNFLMHNESTSYYFRSLWQKIYPTLRKYSHLLDTLELKIIDSLSK
jgi:hypothetical protein